MGLQEPKVISPDAPVPAGAVDAGTAPPASRVEGLVASGDAVLVTLETDAREADPGLLAAASVYAWLGVRWFRVPESQADGMRQVLDMVASIQGTRPPAVARRGLA
ncbi:hypothetical protein E1293_37740 [Actinomadura darangshiensis]|uniref:Uncharacterized protein n=1 Tax=Actinomadura darangshiensis TaxID=705336 RepID=A0A4R5A6W2_9ACTN|nr:hypothetical protein [Actinomadura darangshiensis]TDD67711.1 hypothetical protein E1293_37740 [Actinomadura darangshiensis]